jgi:hypothetical protein
LLLIFIKLNWTYNVIWNHWYYLVCLGANVQTQDINIGKHHQVISSQSANGDNTTPLRLLFLTNYLVIVMSKTSRCFCKEKRKRKDTNTIREHILYKQRIVSRPPCFTFIIMT